MSSRARRILLLPAILIILVAQPFSAADNRTYVIRDAKVYTLSSVGTLPRASVVVADGKIAAVGATVKIPAGAQIINGQGLEVYPGLVNAWSTIGLTEIGSVPATNDSSEMGDFNPQLLAFSAIHPASEHIPVARANGITTSLSAPSGGILSGQAVLLHLDGWTTDEMALLKSAGMVLNYPSLGGRARFGFGGFEGARRQSFAEAKRNYERRIKEISDLLEEARHYANARSANPTTDRDRKLEALVPVVRGESPVFLRAETARDIRNAVEFGKKEKLRIIIQGGREANKVSDLLKKENVSVILESIVALPTREDDLYDARFTVPRDLARAGIKFALTSPSPTLTTGPSFCRFLPFSRPQVVCFQQRLSENPL